ncbi:hypothetical protein NST99_21625 [Paenibacillus sp. FSL L8-0470]|uniref:hypothetical protein n=1 Tax=unclassified Paenibacillus TaxID=185978 RepID=UPI0030F79974
MDKEAKKILLSTFWTSGGWKSSPSPYSGADFEYAKEKGLMFDPVNITHDAVIKRLCELHQKIISKEWAATAFLHSLSTRKVHLRSALSSWALTSELTVHTYGELLAQPSMFSSCGHCNNAQLISDKAYVNQDWNVLNFERIKWGGVRLNWLLYCWLDLEMLAREENLHVSREDLDILTAMTDAVMDCGAKDAARQLEKRWKDVFPSSKQERDVVMEVWGYAGILPPSNEPRPGRGGNGDFISVANWRGEDGYSQEAFKYFFGAFL